MKATSAIIVFWGLIVYLHTAEGAAELAELLEESFLSQPSIVQEYEFERWRARAEAGDIEAQYRLGGTYYQGGGGTAAQPSVWLEQSFSEAKKWWELSAAKGHQLSQFQLGEMYYQGIGVPRNYPEAFRWYKQSALNGFKLSQYKVGEFYARGIGITQDKVRAYIWFSIASAQRYFRARESRDEIESHLTPQELEQAQAQATRCFEANFKDCGE